MVAWAASRIRTIGRMSACMKPRMNSGAGQQQADAGPQTYQRRSNRPRKSIAEAAQRQARGHGEDGDPAENPAGLGRSHVCGWTPGSAPGNWPMPFIAVAARAAPIRTWTNDRFDIRNLKHGQHGGRAADRQALGIGHAARRLAQGEEGHRRHDQGRDAERDRTRRASRRTGRTSRRRSRRPPRPIGAPSQITVVRRGALAGRIVIAEQGRHRRVRSPASPEPMPTRNSIICQKLLGQPA